MRKAPHRETSSAVRRVQQVVRVQGVAVVTGKGGLCALLAAKGCARAEREEQVQVTAAVPFVTGSWGGGQGGHGRGVGGRPRGAWHPRTRDSTEQAGGGESRKGCEAGRSGPPPSVYISRQGCPVVPGGLMR